MNCFGCMESLRSFASPLHLHGSDRNADVHYGNILTSINSALHAIFLSLSRRRVARFGSTHHHLLLGPSRGTGSQSGWASNLGRILSRHGKKRCHVIALYRGRLMPDLSSAIWSRSYFYYSEPFMNLMIEAKFQFNSRVL